MAVHILHHDFRVLYTMIFHEYIDSSMAPSSLSWRYASSAARPPTSLNLCPLLASFSLELVGILQLAFDKYCVDSSDIR